MKKNILIVTLLLFCGLIQAATGNTYLEQGKIAEQKLNEKEALAFYVKAIKQNAKELEALNRASVMCSNIGHRASATASKLSHYEAALIYANAALKINPKDAEANYAMAVAYGRKVYTSSLPKPRIAMSAQIKKYAELAVKYNPKHYQALTILGMWHYERATLTYAEKKIVALLGGLPDGSLSNSLAYLNKSKQIEPHNIATLLELGKVYKELNKINETKAVWQLALVQKNKNEDDKARKLEIKQRLLKI